MKILGMWAQNYSSFQGRHYFNWADRGTVLLMGRNLDDPKSKSNASGKSSLCDALEWCLFGEVPRGDTADSIVNVNGKGGTCVTVHVLDDDGHLIQVQRLRDYPKHKNGVNLAIDGQDKTKLDTAATQEDINKYLGMDREVFRCAVNFAQGNTFNFADATDSERKAILTKVLQLEEIDIWAERLNTKLKEAEAQKTQATINLQRAQDDLQRLQATNLEQQSQNWQNWHHSALQAAEQAFASATAAHQEAQRQYEGATQPPPPDNDGTSPLYNAQTGARVYQSQCQMAVREAEGAVHSLRGSYAHVQTQMRQAQAQDTGKCSSCGQPVSTEHKAQEAARFAAQLAQLEAEGQAAAAKVEPLKAALASADHALAQIESQLREHQQDLASKRAAYQALRSQVDALANHRDQTSRSQQDAARNLKQLQQQTNPHLAAMQQLAKDCQAKAAEVGILEGNLAFLNKDVTHLEFWKYGLGPKGLKSWILDSKIEELTREVNRWVHMLTGGTVWVRFETQKEVGSGKNKKLSESLTLRAFRHNPDGTTTERNYRSWSGGEKQRIALGVDFGLAQLVANRSNRRYDLIIADELFQKGLDSAGKEAVAELLSHLEKEKSTILVIDHDVIFQGLFQETLIVEKHNGRSRVIGADDGKPSTTTGILSDDKVLASHPAFP